MIRNFSFVDNPQCMVYNPKIRIGQLYHVHMCSVVAQVMCPKSVPLVQEQLLQVIWGLIYCAMLAPYAVYNAMHVLLDLPLSSAREVYSNKSRRHRLWLLYCVWSLPR